MSNALKIGWRIERRRLIRRINKCGVAEGVYNGDSRS